MLNFQFSGFKFKKKLNFGVIYSEEQNCVGAAVYTKNEIQAAPIVLSKEADNKSKIKRAIVINSGTANAFTGEKGFKNAECMINIASTGLGLKNEEIYIASTGVIGTQLPIADIKQGLQQAITGLSISAADEFASAILTTDTCKKVFHAECQIDGKRVEIMAIAKGSGMIMPDMATMICCVCTNAHVEQATLHKALKDISEKTFNCITVDGDTSTNDCIFALADGTAENNLITERSKNYPVFYDCLYEILTLSAMSIVRDGEGMTKFITVELEGVPTTEQASKVAFSIANSPLVKTAFYGESFNWGRIMMAIGKAQAGLDYTNIAMSINGIQILCSSEYVPSENDIDLIAQSLRQVEQIININFNQGDEGIRVWTCDFSLDYVKINADYLS